MFDFLFGWSKASKCKKLIKRARCRLKLLKNKKLVTARQSRKDVAQLIKNGLQHIALNQVERVIKDERLASAYELLDYFCEFILTQFPYIRRHRECPNDINEAVSSLIFASARCGDVPELCVIKKLFGQRYGDKFATISMKLFPGNLVNQQLKEKLSVNAVPDDLKYRVIDEIARDYCLQPKVLAIEYCPGWQQIQVEENRDASITDTIAGSKRNGISVNSSVRKSNEYTYPLQKNLEKVEYFDNNGVSKRKHERRRRRRSASIEKQGIMQDIGYLIYYHKPYRSLSPYKGNSVIPRSSYAQKRLKKNSSSQGTKRRTSCAYDDDKLCLGGLVGECCHWNEELYEVVYNVFTYPDCQTYKQNETIAETSESMGRFGSSEVVKKWRDKKMLRTYSCPPHPKLPDYDDLATKFTALKRERLQNQNQNQKNLL